MPKTLSPDERRAHSAKIDQASLARLKSEFDSGDVGALLAAIDIAARRRIVLPTWAANAFAERYRAVKYRYEHNSWDRVFGHPNPGARKLSSQRRASEIQGWLALRVWQLRAQRPKPKDIFGIVADEFNIGSKLAEKLYLSWQNFYFGNGTELFAVQKSPRKKKDK